MPLGPIPAKVMTESKKIYDIDPTWEKGGGEAMVYKLDSETAAKIYNEVSRVESLKDKIRILIAQSKNIPDNIISPLGFIYSLEDDENPLGYRMQLLENANPISVFQWSDNFTAEEENLLDHTIANFLYDLADSLEILHANRIFVGDLKLDNILVSNNRAYIIDFDSCSLSDYPSDNVFTLQYVDPMLRGDSPTALGPFLFSEKSDWWALAVVAFHLFMGASPWTGSHPTMKDAKTRSFNYSVAGFDPNVKIPRLMRSMEWLNGRPKLKAYFQHIFSNDQSKRFSINYPLAVYFNRVHYSKRKDNPRLDKLFRSLSQEHQDFLINVIKELQAINQNKIFVKREEERLKFIQELLTSR